MTTADVTDARFGELRERREQLLQEKAAAINEFRRRDRTAAQIVSPSIIDVDEAMTALGKDTVLVQYHVTGDTAIAFVVTSEAISLVVPSRYSCRYTTSGAALYPIGQPARCDIGHRRVLEGDRRTPLSVAVGPDQFVRRGPSPRLYRRARSAPGLAVRHDWTRCAIAGDVRAGPGAQRKRDGGARRSSCVGSQEGVGAREPPPR